MQLNLKQLNALPQRTWRWLGVNGENIERELPDVRPYGGRPFAGPAPAGAEVLSVAADEVGFMDDETDPTLHADVVRFVRAAHNGGYFIRAARGKRVSEPVVLDYRLDGQNPVVVDDNLILAEAGSEITVVMHYASDEKAEGVHMGLTKVLAQKGTVVHLVQVQTLGDGCDHFDQVGVSTQAGAKVELIQAEMGGRSSYSGFQARLEGEGSALDMRTVYLGDGARKLDIGAAADHYGRRTTSRIVARGALLDRSEKIFRGTIDFKKGSAGSKGREDEYAILLSPHVRNRTAPLILCQEEDVDGHHAASTGRMDADRLFYLMSRGLSEAEAKKLMIEAEFTPITARIPVEAYRREISEFLGKRLSRVE